MIGTICVILGCIFVFGLVGIVVVAVTHCIHEAFYG